MPSTLSAQTFLGFAIELGQDQLFTLGRQFLPLGKIGGFPSWLDPTTIPSAEELACSNCQSPMVFLMQIYCPGQAKQPHAFHRVLYVFACHKGECSKTNEATNFAIFRCQLPRTNPFYSPTESLNPDLVGDTGDPFFNGETFAKLCIICGTRAEKRCSKCSKRMYCSRDHQIIDWKTLHKGECNTPEQKDYSAMSSIEKAELRQKHGFTFREFGMEMTAEEAESDLNENSEEEDDDEEEMDDDKIREEKQKIKKFEELAVANGVSAKDFEGLEENRNDVAFKRFSQAIGEEPEQVIRYRRGGEPQLATDYSPEPKNIPDCPICEQPRHFEFQLMPHLLRLIGVDSVEQSLDWATLMVYTCQNDCPIPDGYARECVFKQDFVIQPKEEGEK